MKANKQQHLQELQKQLLKQYKQQQSQQLQQEGQEEVQPENEEKEESSDDPEAEEQVMEDMRTVLASEMKRLKKNKQYANDVAAMQLRLRDILLKKPKTQNTEGEDEPLPWIETLTMSVGNVELENVNDDLAREKQFYDLSLIAANFGLNKLASEGIPYTRPEDFFAEMIKSDTHMSKVKGVLLQEKRQIEEAQKRTRVRLDRKFLRKAQADAQQKRQKEKKEEQKAIKKWRKTKGGKDEEFPEELLDKNSKLRKKYDGGQDEDRKSKGKRVSKRDYKDQKYGMGGKKRGLKSNTADSSADMSMWSTQRNKGLTFSAPLSKKGRKKNATVGGPGSKGKGKGKGAGSKGKGKSKGKGGEAGGGNRPGKRKRQQGWTSSGGKKVKKQRK